MATEVSWAEVLSTNADYIREIFAREHHNHVIVKDKHGVFRWKADPVIDMLFTRRALDLNKLFMNGADKNDPLVRLLYRQLGYSLFGYWETFHWEVNNPKADEYNDPI